MAFLRAQAHDLRVRVGTVDWRALLHRPTVATPGAAGAAETKADNDDSTNETDSDDDSSSSHRRDGGGGGGGDDGGGGGGGGAAAAKAKAPKPAARKPDARFYTGTEVDAIVEQVTNQLADRITLAYNMGGVAPAELRSLNPVTFRGCSNCGVSEDGRKLKKCGRCKRSHYCSRDCQAAHWAKHKTVCAREAANQKNIAG
jgi:hypothetical protein